MTAPSAPVPAFASAGNLVYRAETVPRFVSGRGCYLTDTTGREYLDAEAANGTLPFGYDPTILEEALKACHQMPALPSFCESDQRLDVLRRLEALFSSSIGANGRVDLDLGGAQGMETALRIVAANRGQGTVVVFEGAFHGRSAATSMLSSSPRYRELLAAWGLEVVRLPSPDCFRCPHRPTDGGCSTGCARATTRWGSEVSGVGGPGHARRAVAFVFEPVLNVAGMVEPDHELLRQAVDHARRQGALVIADEIFTGMHRVGPRWGFERSGVSPDIVVASKGLTNGAAAASVVWAREPLAAPATYHPGSHSSTYIGLPHALGVLATVLGRWEGWTTATEDVAQLGRWLDLSLREVAAAHPTTVVETHVMGAAARLRLGGPWAARVRTLARDTVSPRGLIVAATGMAPDVINIHPPLVAKRDDVEVLGTLLDEALTLLEAEVRV